MKKDELTYPTLVGSEVIRRYGDTIYSIDSRKQWLHHPTMKKAFIQVGKRFQLPDDIVDIIYGILRMESIVEETSTRRFHRNVLLLNVLVGGQYNIDCNNLYDCKGDEYVMGNPFDYRIPNNRNCEWAIKNSSNKRLKFNVNNVLEEFHDIREKMFIEICILGEEHYLFDIEKMNTSLSNTSRFKPADRNVKLRYLDNNSFEEVYFDYQNYLEWKGTPNESSWTLIIDASGDAAFFSGI